MALGPFSESSYLRLDSHYTNLNLLLLSLRIFRARFLRELFRFEWLRRKVISPSMYLHSSHCTTGSGISKFIARARLRIKNPKYSQAEGRHELMTRAK